ncbi:MAG: hypothetical protein [Bacteriophage sp.]|nr:MAG: hypothetical protein [Bacteriophage sp.]
MACIDHGKAGSKGGYAYHSKRINGKQPLMHRLAYAAAYGLDEATMGGVVMHSCDNPRCINPEHLSLGTQLDNIADRQTKGRQARGATWNGAHSEAHYQAKLSHGIADTIRQRYIPRCSINGGRALAREYGVAHIVIQKILNGSTWNRKV